MSRVILASASPRRRELLAALLDDFDVEVSGVDEPLDAEPVENALSLARSKAADVASRNGDAVVIGADTIVFRDGKSYGKPENNADAMNMWRELRGVDHEVVTGVVVLRDEIERSAFSIATVALSDLSEAAIRAYVASGRPLDKAGAYAIQDEDVPTVSRLEGCYCAVMGLPLWRLRRMLESAGVEANEPSQRFGRCRECPERAELPSITS